MTERAIAVRKLSADEALACSDRLRAIFREAVLAVGPRSYSPSQVAAWASSADDVAAWEPWLRDGVTFVASHDETPAAVVGLGVACPTDHVHLLYVDPTFHRRGVASALLAALENDARAAGVAALTTDASLISAPVFAAGGYELVAWEDVERRGQVFRRARMRKGLR